MKFSSASVIALLFQSVAIIGSSSSTAVAAATSSATAEEMTDQQCLDLCSAQRAASVKVPAGTSMANAISTYLQNKANGVTPASPYGDDINCWDTSDVTSMYAAFRQQFDFNEDIQCWDTSNVTNMEAMFQLAYNFNQPINRWDVSSVQKMNMMFQAAWRFNQALDGWDTSNVQSMYYMFYQTQDYNSPIFEDVSSVTNMYAMFKESASFNRQLSQWESTIRSDANVCNMFDDAAFDIQTDWMDSFPCLSEYSFTPAPPSPAPSAAPTTDFPTASPTLGSTWNGQLELEADGSMGRDLVKIATYAAQASAGVYWGFDIDLDITFGSSNVPDWVSPGSFEDARVFRKNNICYATFRGREVDPGYDWKREAIATWTFGVVDTGATNEYILMENINDMYQDVKNSEKTTTVNNDLDESCTFNDFLIEDWVTTHWKTSPKYVLDYHIPDCMQDCFDNYSYEECFVIYTGHSQGGVSAMASALYLKDHWVHMFNPPGIITFGQPGTFNDEVCDPLQDWIGNYIYRFMNIDYEYSKTTLDNAVAVGGNHIGNAIFLSEEGDDAAMYMVEYDDAYGIYGQTFDSLEINFGTDYDNNIKKSSCASHDVNEGYKDKMEKLMVMSSSFYRLGKFDTGFRCTEDFQCASESCSGGKCT